MQPLARNGVFREYKLKILTRNGLKTLNWVKVSSKNVRLQKKTLNVLRDKLSFKCYGGVFLSKTTTNECNHRI